MYTYLELQAIRTQIQSLFFDYPSIVVPPSTVLISQNQENHSVILLESGLVAMHTDTQSGNRILISLFGPHDLFPLSAILLQKDRAKDFSAITNSTYKKIPVPIFSRRLEENAVLKDYVVWSLAQRHQNLIDQVIAFKSNTAAMKIQAIFSQLENLCRLEGLESSCHHLSQQDIADLAGVSRETVSRYFNHKGL